jgi:hypothetical protein
MDKGSCRQLSTTVIYPEKNKADTNISLFYRPENVTVNYFKTLHAHSVDG